MPWRASHIYCQPGALDLLRRHPLFARGLYHVDHLRGHRWPTSGARHGLPPDGLIVVRELRAPDRCGTPERLPWNEVSTQGDLDLPCATTDLPKTGFDEAWSPGYEPPLEALLGLIKGLAQASATTAAYYFHLTHGGTTEAEVAWIFGGGDGTGSADCCLEYMDNEHMRVRWAQADDERREGGVLTDLMARFGLTLDGPWPYFALHDTNFRWKGYKL